MTNPPEPDARPAFDDAKVLRIVGANIRQARVAAGLEVAELATAADVPADRIAVIESADEEITMVELLRIARALGPHPSSLLAGV